MAILALGTELKRGDGGSPETFTKVPGLISVGGGPLQGQSDEIDVTDHDSPNGFEEILLGIKRGAEMPVEFNYDPQNALHKGIVDDYINRTARNWELVLKDPGASKFTFTAFVKNFPFDAPVEGVYRGTFTLKVSGAVTPPA